MFTNYFKGIFLFSFCLLLFSMSGKAQSLSGSIAKGSIARGKSAKGVLILSIPDGLHINTNRPNSPYAIPTTVKLIARGVKINGPVFPRGKTRPFQFSRDSINVYEGKVRFPFMITVPAGFRGDAVNVRAVVRYQACTDEVCYPPRTTEITISARVK
ncbi:MAG: hypothetical protein C4324_09420 [Blastocatellia bacterium]